MHNIDNTLLFVLSWFIIFPLTRNITCYACLVKQDEDDVEDEDEDDIEE